MAAEDLALALELDLEDGGPAFDGGSFAELDPYLFDLDGVTVDGVPLIPPWADPANADFFWLKPEFARSPDVLDVVTRFEQGTFDPATASPQELVRVGQALGIASPELVAWYTQEPAFPEAAGAGIEPSAPTAEPLLFSEPIADAVRDFVAEHGALLNDVSLNTQTRQFVDETGQPVTSKSNPSLWERINKVLGTPLGQLGGALGLGALGVLLGQAFTSDDKLRMPEPPPPTPAQAAGQSALAAALGGTAAPRGGVPTPGTGAPAAGGVQTVGGVPVPVGPGGIVPGTNVAPANLPGVTAFDPGLFFGRGPSGTSDLTSTVASGVAGQRNVADALMAATGREFFTQSQQAPAESVARGIALAQIPGLMDRTTAARVMSDPLLASLYGEAFRNVTTPGGRASDPLLAAIYDQALQAVSGGRASPQLERQFQEEERAIRNKLFRQVGEGYETSTPGIQALAEMRQRHNELRDRHSLSAVSAFAPLALAREQFGESTRGRVTSEALAREQFAEQNRQRGLAENINIASTFGRQPLGQLTSQLNTIVPTMPLLGIDTAEQDRRLNQQLNNQLALASFQSQQASDRQLANSISGIFGTAAGALGRSGSTTFRRNPDGTTTIF